MSSSKKSPKQQKMPDPKELLALQAEYNRVNVDTPFGSQTYVPDGNGGTTLRTDIGPQGQQLVNRGVSLGMTDSNRMSVDPRMNQLAGALLGNVGKRFGMDLGGSLQLAPDPNMPQGQAKAQTQQMPAPSPSTAAPLPQGGASGGPSFTGGPSLNMPQNLQLLQQLQQQQPGG